MPFPALSTLTPATLALRIGEAVSYFEEGTAVLTSGEAYKLDKLIGKIPNTNFSTVQKSVSEIYVAISSLQGSITSKYTAASVLNASW